ncbi:MAG: hypothetical protein C5B59_20875 [Bacteroidetes bacterium]|nr:MAG: hypothetical protein C5B59_20875 [Bacteroidota bacterium]
MRTITFRLAVLASGVAMMLYLACSKENSSNSNPNVPAGQSRVSVYMTDGPAQFYKVLVDIRQVAVLIDTATKQSDPDDDHEWGDDWMGWHRDEHNKSLIWDTLSIKPGIYDLLRLRNGTDTLLASGNYPNGKILKVRMTLGSDNTLYTDSLTSYPLEVFGPHPYVDINVRRENILSLSSNDFKLWLDFSLQRSIFFWNGTFYLKPYIVAFNDHDAARIQGVVLPEGASPLVEAFNSTDTVYAIPGDEGRYLIRGVKVGTYSVTIFGHHGYNDTTISNIVVDSVATTKVPTITLHQ